MPMKVRYTSGDGEIIAESRGGMRKLYLSDPLGSTVTLVDNTQTKTRVEADWRRIEGQGSRPDNPRRR